MARLTNEIVNEIVNSCLYVYTKLPKTGKPVEKEWTVLSCVVQYNVLGGTYDVVSLGTGSKCIGAVKMTPDGTLLNDSHAEAFARRGFLLYLYDNLERTLKNESSIFTHECGKFVLKEDIVFIFYSSQLPCGDASIIPKTGEEEQFGDVIESKKRSVEDVHCEERKKLKLENDIHRTGAKCLPEFKQDPKDDGNKYHLVNQVRTKPGRGDRTLSVSCSDKMARWTHIGIQGALLDILLTKEIYIKHFIFGAGVPYSEEALRRAFLKRDLDHEVYLKCIPEFYQCSVIFDGVRTQEDLRPAPGSIVWTKLYEPFSEVAVQGRKLGVTKKKATSPSTSLCISKYKLYEKFQLILSMDKAIKENVTGDNSHDVVPYGEMKRKATRYQNNWTAVKEDFFKMWTVKPDMWNFCIKSSGLVQSTQETCG